MMAVRVSENSDLIRPFSLYETMVVREGHERTREMLFPLLGTSHSTLLIQRQQPSFPQRKSSLSSCRVLQDFDILFTPTSVLAGNKPFTGMGYSGCVKFHLSPVESSSNAYSANVTLEFVGFGVRLQTIYIEREREREEFSDQ
jgi:hypothetical protein